VGELRTPVFLVAVALAVVALLIELGTLALPPGLQRPGATVAAICAADQPPPGCDSDQGRSDLANQVQTTRLNQPPTPGLGIPAMALVDVTLVLILGIMAAALVVPARLHGRVQGIVGLIVSFLVILAAIVVALRALAQLILMVSILLAFPFGTIIYLIIWGFFDRGGAAVALGLLFLIKIVLAACLGISHQAFITDKGMIVLVAATLISGLVVSFLHGLVPGFLVSITDAIAAIVVAIIGIVVAILALLGSIVSIVRALSPRV
jgi:hypothetical protein